MRILDKLPAPGKIGIAWLEAVRVGSLAGDAKTLKIAAEIARVIRFDGSGDLPSPIDLAKPVGLSEDAAIAAVNALIAARHIMLKYIPLRAEHAFIAHPAPQSVNAPLDKISAEAAVVAAVDGLPLAEAISVMTSAMAAICVADGVDPHAEAGKSLLATVDKLLRQRITALRASRAGTPA